MSPVPMGPKWSRADKQRLARVRESRRGDTLIEIMAAMVLAAIGMVGIASLQGSTVRSNQDSQEIGFAVSFGRTWIQRIKRDALGWQAPGAPNVTVLLANRTPNTSTTYFVPGGGWGLPVPLDASESPGANSRGMDIGSPAAIPALLPVIPVSQLHYCVNTSFTAIQVNAANQVEKMDASVRVWWGRRASLDMASHNDPSVKSVRDGQSCIVPSALALTSSDLRVLYLSTPLRYGQ